MKNRRRYQIDPNYIKKLIDWNRMKSNKILLKCDKMIQNIMKL